MLEHVQNIINSPVQSSSREKLIHNNFLQKCKKKRKFEENLEQRQNKKI